MITVASFYAARPLLYPDAPDYRPLLDLLEHSVLRWANCRHVCITDAATAPTLPCATFVAPLPALLMPAILRGQAALLRATAEQPGDVLLVGADCLVNRRHPATAFMPSADVVLTSRSHRRWPINTGAIWVRADARHRLADLWDVAAEECTAEWGSDQDAIARLFAPVPLPSHEIVRRAGLALLFQPMASHNASPWDAMEASDARVVHFKGPRKAFMPAWAARHLGLNPGRVPQ